MTHPDFSSSFARVRAATLVACIPLGAGCAASRPSDATQPSPSTEPGAADAARPPALVETIPESWQELERIAQAVIVGPWQESPADDFPSGCVSPARVVHGNVELVDGGFCLDRHDRLDGAEWVALPTPAEAWVVVLSRPGQALLVAVAGTRDGVLEKTRCGLLDRVWRRMPAADRACEADADCVLLASMCFAEAVAASAAAPYREVVRRFGGVCLHPAGGACPPSDDRAVCRERVCVVAR